MKTKEHALSHALKFYDHPLKATIEEVNNSNLELMDEGFTIPCLSFMNGAQDD